MICRLLLIKPCVKSRQLSGISSYSPSLAAWNIATHVLLADQGAA
jgi:hypothetical protein